MPWAVPALFTAHATLAKVTFPAADTVADTEATIKKSFHALFKDKFFLELIDKSHLKYLTMGYSSNQKYLDAFHGELCEILTQHALKLYRNKGLLAVELFLKELLTIRQSYVDIVRDTMRAHIPTDALRPRLEELMQGN